jgi:AhpD family alkylhydroperoxidase
MPHVKPVEYDDASPEVKAVYDDIKASRKISWINNFWKVLASHPPTLKRTWEALRDVMRPGALDVKTKEMLFLAVSVANNCEYCIASHMASARAHGVSEAELGELMAVISKIGRAHV